MALGLVDDEEDDPHPDCRERLVDEREDERRHGAQDRPDVGDHLGHGGEGPEEEGVVAGAGPGADHASNHMPRPAEVPMMSDTMAWPRT